MFRYTTCLFLALTLGVSINAQPSLEQKVNDYVKPYVATKNFNGVILVAQKGKLLYQKAFGMANLDLHVVNTTETKFHLASVSKNFTAAAILMLEQRHQLQLSDPISKFLPEFPGGNDITIHQLLNHTSGIPNINDMSVYDTIALFPQTPASLINAFKNKPRDFKPGEKYAYSNSNYNILAYIIEKVSGMSYGDFMEQNIFKPLGMQHTSHHTKATETIIDAASGYQSDGNFGLEKSAYLDWTSKTGNGSLYSTAGDLLIWDRALASGKILTEASLTKMYTNYGAGAGYGCFVKDHLNRKRYYMNGRSPGFTSYFARYPEEELCIVVLDNNYIPVVTKIGMDLAAIFFNEKYEVPDLATVKKEASVTTNIVGSYQFDEKFYRPNYVLNIRENNGFLFSQWEELLPKTDWEYTGRTYWSSIHFIKDEKGKITSMDYDGHIGLKLPK